MTPGIGEARCAECGQVFSADQLTTIAGRFICGACKPAAAQKLQDGVVTFGQTVDPEELGRMVEEKRRDYNLSIGSLIGRAWELVKGNFWPCIGITLLCYLIMVGSSQIPLIGLAANFLVQPQIFAGLMWYFLKQYRGEEAVLNDVFEGFRRGYGQQAIYMLIVYGIVLACIIPVGIFAALAVIVTHGAHSADAVHSLLFYPLILVLIVVMWYLMLRWVFVPLLILDKGLTATVAMKLSSRVARMHFWKILGLLVVVGLLSMASLLAFLVGFFVMLPVAFATITRLYEDFFGEHDTRPRA
jgi:hypothetical protein